MFETIGTTLGVAFAGTLALAVLGLLVWSLVWVYRDAQARGKPGWAVTLVVLLLKWPISLLLWVIFRPERLLPQKPAA